MPEQRRTLPPYLQFLLLDPHALQQTSELVLLKLLSLVRQYSTRLPYNPRQDVLHLVAFQVLEDHLLLHLHRRVLRQAVFLVLRQHVIDESQVLIVVAVPRLQHVLAHLLEVRQHRADFVDELLELVDRVQQRHVDFFLIHS